MAASGADNTAKAAKLRAMFEGWAPKFKEVAHIDIDELKRRMADDEAAHGAPAGGADAPRLPDLVLVDVREVEESNVSVIRSRITLTKQEFEAQRNALRDAGDTIVVYCTAGYRSGLYAASLLRHHGFSKDRVLNLQGSILAATQAGMPLVTRGGGQHVEGAVSAPPRGSDAEVPTKRVHVWGPSFAEFAGPGYEVVVPKAASRPGLIMQAVWQTFTNWWEGSNRRDGGSSGAQR